MTRKRKPKAGTNQEPDRALAARIVVMLNDMLTLDPKATLRLIETRVHCNDQFAEHPTIQVSAEQTVGLLGVLNGLCGVIPSGPLKGRGLITAEGLIPAKRAWRDGRIDRFVLTEKR